MPAHAQQAPPVIAAVEPGAGPPGTLLRITGRKLCAQTRVLLGQTELPIELCTPSVVTARVPRGAESAALVLETSAGKLEGPRVRVLPAPPAPVVRRISPTRGGPGTLVALEGANFSLRLAENDVRFGEVAAVVASASGGQLQVWVPEVSGSVNVRVRVEHAGEASAPLPFEVLPKLALQEIVPPRAAPRAQLDLRGQGFDPDPARNRVRLGTSNLRVLEASPVRLRVQLPPDAASGMLSVALAAASGKSEQPRAPGASAPVELPFEVLRVPSIAALEPPAGPSGTLLRVRGEGFGSDPQLLEVKLGELPVPLASCTPNELTLRVPPAAVSGKLSVSVRERGQAVSNAEFIRTEPLALNEVHPSGAPAGSAVTLRGRGFSPRPGDQRVTFAGVPAELLSASATELSVRVPEAKTGPIAVELGGQRVASRAAFVVTNPPRISKVSPEKPPAEGELVIQGSGFGEHAALLRVTLGDRALRVLKVSDQQLVVQLPDDSIEGELSVHVALQGAVSYPRPIRTLAKH